MGNVEALVEALHVRCGRVHRLLLLLLLLALLGHIGVGHHLRLLLRGHIICVGHHLRLLVHPGCVGRSVVPSRRSSAIARHDGGRRGKLDDGWCCLMVRGCTQDERKHHAEDD